MMPLVVVGCPVQNRESVIRFYLEHIYELDYPKDRIILAFFVNNSSDNTARIINAFIESRGGEYHDCLYFEDNKIYKGKVDGQHRLHRDFTLFSVVRNAYLRYIKQHQWDYLFSVDSDILVEPQSLRQLVAHDTDIVSCLVFNGSDWGHDWYNYRVYTKNPLNGKEGYYTYKKIPEKIFRVDSTGACYLIKREVIDAGVQYKPHKWGEDVPFCEDARSKGFHLYCDPTLKPTHILAGDIR